jgi:hypothetical protein
MCSGLVSRIEEDMWAVAGDDDPLSEALARFVVQIMGAQALAEAEAVGLVVEVDLDAPFVLLHGVG